jgi:hypothetical protein
MRYSLAGVVRRALLLCMCAGTFTAILAGAVFLAGCTSGKPTSTVTSSTPSTTVASTSTSDPTSTTAPDITTETATQTTVEKPVKPAAELLHLWWRPGDYWDPNRIEDFSVSDADFNPNSSRIVGDAYVYQDPVSGRDYLFATGEDGKLLVVTLRFDGPNAHEYSSAKFPASTGLPLRELLGGRSFNSPLASPPAVLGTGADRTIHVFATDTADNLIHFWFKTADPGQLQLEGVKSESLTSVTGISVARVGSARVAGDGATIEVCALNPDDELLYFRLAPGGQWSAENPSKLTGRVAKKEATFFADPLGVSDITIASSCLLDHLLLYRRAVDGTWTLEDITQETTTEKADPGVSLGGWLSWWDWQSKDYWDPSQFQSPLAILTTAGHFQLLERASTDAPWKVTDVSKLTGVIFAANGGGDSIIRLHTPPGGSPKEAHFAGVDTEQNLIHFWRDAQGRWHTENLTAKTGQNFAYPLDHSTSQIGVAGTAVWAASHATPPDYAVLEATQFLSGVAPDGRLIVLWAGSDGTWHPADATAAIGYKVRGPDVVWSDGNANHLVMAGTE